MRPRLAALVAALTVVPMTVATMAGPTQAQEPHPRNSSTSTKTASPQAVAAAAGSTAKPLKVVLLGDSYSAGNGARDASDDRDYYGPSGCFRSHSNWSSKYVELLQRDGYNVTFDNRACSGGVTSGMVSPRNMDTKTRQTVVPGANTVDQATAALATLDPCNTRSYIDEEYWTYKALAPSATVATVWTYSCTRWLRPQTDFVGADTDLVLFTIGGNDIKFESIVKQCFVPGPRSPGDCRNAVNEAEGLLPGVRTGILAAIAKMRSNGLREDAKVVIPGYPLLAMDDDFALKQWFGLGSDSYAVSQNVRALGRLGNDKQAEAITAANAGHAGQVIHVGDIPTLFSGHEPNASATSRNPNRWLWEIAETRTIEEFYHPNPTGHTAYAQHLYRNGIFGAGIDTVLGGDLDIVFAIDTTGSMGDDIEAAKQYARDLVSYVSANSTSSRFAVVSYRDHPEWTGESVDYPARVDQTFTSSAADVEAALGSLEADGGGDEPESMLSGIKAGIDLPWRAGVKKLVIVLADAPAHNPEPVTGYTAADIVAAAAAVDPAVVYAVNTYRADSNGALSTITQQTGGAIFDASTSGGVAAALQGITADALVRPHAWINGPYVAPIGRTVTLDASGSYATDGSLVSYAWDFTSDGTVDETTTVPQVNHAWAEAFSGLATVTVTDTVGRTAVANTHVGITRDGDEIPDADDNCPDEANMGQEDYDNDGVGDVCDPTPGLPAADKAGVVEGKVGDEPAAVTSPTMTGKARAGQRVSVTAGQWTGSPVLSYQWTRSGVPIAGATGTSYVLRRGDIGKKVAPLVLARDPRAPAGSTPAVTAAPARTVGKFLAKVNAKVRGGALTVKVRSKGQKRVYGWLRVTEGKKLVAKVKVTAKTWRRTKVTLRGLAVGKHKLTVRFAGNKLTAPAKKKVKIRIK